MRWIGSTLRDIVNELRQDATCRLFTGRSGDRVDTTFIADEFRRLSIDEALKHPFHLSHFKLDRFYGACHVSHGFDEQVMKPWEAILRRLGFTWDRVYPGIFAVGNNCSTYYMDCLHVVAWEFHDEKAFHVVKDQERWAPVADAQHPAEFFGG